MSRKIADLQPDTAHRAHLLQQYAEESGLDLLIYCTHRTLEEQARLFRRGRRLSQIQLAADQLRERYKRPDLSDILIGVGPQMEPTRVTNAPPGMSAHNYGEAFDAVPLIHGKPLWTAYRVVHGLRKLLPEWERYGELASLAGLEWAGKWTTFREFPHSQMPGFDWRGRIETTDFDKLKPRKF